MQKNSKNVHVDYLNFKTDEELLVEGYTESKLKLTVTWILISISLGLLRLLFYWRADLLLKCTHVKCSLKQASKVLLKDKYAQLFVENIEIIENLNIGELLHFEKHLSETWSDENETDQLLSSTRYFTNKRVRYYWHNERDTFVKLKGLEDDYELNFFRKHKCLSAEQSEKKLLVYGKNSIRVEITPLATLFFKEVLSPFYIFQIFSVILWLFENYYLFAACIFIISVTSVIYSLYSIRRNEKALRNMIHKTDQVEVIRSKIENGKLEFYEQEIDSEFLVPGDVIEIKNSSIMQCDAVLLNGNVIVNESMLTGESIPITKTGLGYHEEIGSKKKLNIKENKKNILYSGTQVIQARYYSNDKAKAIVLRTGFSTSKGELIRTILFPKPSEFKFNKDLYKYIAALAFISVIGMIFTISIKAMKKKSFFDILIKSLDLVSIVVPPALQGALTACLLYAQNRLKKEKIYCISPNTINVCGSLDTFVFDKTGTLTEDDSDLKCLVPFKQEFYFGKEIKKMKELDEENFYRIIELMAACNSITYINGKLDGDPLDLKLFNFTQWELVEPTLNEVTNFDMLMPTIVRPTGKTPQTKLDGLDNKLYEIGIIKQFPFLSALQRMSVVIRSLSRKNFEFYCKGSPEIVASMCKPESLPQNFHSVLRKYTRKGYRVLGMGYKVLDESFSLVRIEKSERECLECDMYFMGLIIMENKLKPETTSVIKGLRFANIRTIMCTGDNLLTGISVSRECGILSNKDKVIVVDVDKDLSNAPKYIQSDLDSDLPIDNFELILQDSLNLDNIRFAIDGTSFEIIRNNYPSLYNDLIRHGSVFARMGPDQKQQLIEELRNQHHFVGMCGDGANDCGALKAANAGISLSNAEASIASPFTSRNPNIECVPTVIKEGRATLITSFGVVKFICMYSLTQFISVILLYTNEQNLSDMQFLYIDMVLITFIAFFFSRNKPFEALDKNAPSNKLIAWRPIASLTFHTLFLFTIQFFVLYFVRIQPWFQGAENSLYQGSDEVSAVFLVSTFQYLTEAIIFSKGLPYRKSIFSNKLLITAISIAFCVNLLLCLGNFKSLTNFFLLKTFPDLKFRFFILQIALIHFFVSFLLETFLFDEKSTKNPSQKQNILNNKI